MTERTAGGMIAPSTEHRDQVGVTDLLPRTPHILWANLPVLTFGSLLVAAGTAAVVLAGPGITPIAVAVAALVVGPTWAGLVEIAGVLLRGGDVGARDLIRAVRRRAMPAITVFAVPAAAGIAALLTLTMWQQRAAPWMLGSLIVSTGVTILTSLGSVVALPLHLWIPELRGRTLWYSALGIVARRPLVPLGVFAAAILGALAMTSWTASLLPLIPAPLALLTAAGVWTAARSAGFPVPSVAPLSRPDANLEPTHLLLD